MCNQPHKTDSTDLGRIVDLVGRLDVPVAQVPQADVVVDAARRRGVKKHILVALRQQPPVEQARVAQRHHGLVVAAW
jgi:hypothetical protein